MNEIAIVGTRSEEFAKEVNTLFIPNKVMMASESANPDFPLLADKKAEGKTLIYLCKNYECQLPNETIEGFMQQLTASKK